MIELYNGDCIKIMQDLIQWCRGKVDAIITDPPYGIANEVVITRTRNTMKFKTSKDINHNFGEWDKFNTMQDFFDFTFAWVDLAIELLRDGGMFISYFDRDKINFLSHYLQHKGFKFKGYYADCKTNPVPQARKVKWQNGWEMAGLWQKGGGKLTYNYQLGQHKDYGIRPIVSGKERTKHPTQKPILVIRDFVLWWTNEGDLILDPFMGSGTTGVVAKALNRRFIGIEQNEEYYRIARDRIEELELELK